MNPFPGIHPLATLNALLNSVATVLLIVGWIAIARGYWRAHRAAMVVAFATSALFLVSYLAYHALEGSRRYAGPDSLRLPYYGILLTHVLLAAAVPLLALRMFFLAWKGRWQDHRRLGRLTMPIWLYVSVTGVLIYLLLYHVPAEKRRISVIEGPPAARIGARAYDGGQGSWRVAGAAGPFSFFNW
jgi:uncharacterized membrane protein YozB (DUF420 family)